MGLALAQAFKARGAFVTLIAGPGVEKLPGLKCIPVTSARDMLAVAKQHFPRCDAFISVAAVADYRPAGYQSKKMPKKAGGLRLKLVANPDILSEMGRSKKKQITVGFSLQDSVRTARDVSAALRKMRAKRCDLMVLNSLDAMDSKKISAKLIFPDRSVSNLGTISKEACASKICQAIQKLTSF